MAKTRVYELARDLKVSNKALLDKVQALGINAKSYINPHLILFLLFYSHNLLSLYISHKLLIPPEN